MSQLPPQATSAKKRKHGATVGAPDAGADVEERLAKRSKKDKAHSVQAQTGVTGTEKTKDKKKDKKKKTKPSEGSAGEGGEFHVVQSTVRLSIPPVFANDLPAGARELLDSMLMRYLPALQGVLLAHDHLRFIDSKARIKDECPFAISHVSFDAVVWRPQVGMRLVGKLSLSSPDHISLLLHRTFNVSIPRHHIPVDEWAFEYGPAENDPEFGPGAGTEGEEPAEKNEDGEKGEEGAGRWVHKVTGVRLGEPEGYLEFTVIGLTIANQMLSLIGSLHSDPFSPAHLPPTAKPAAPPSPSRLSPSPSVGEAAAEEDSEDEEDTFGMLGRMGDDALRKENEEKAKREEEQRAKKERKEKRRRKEDGDEAGGKKKKRKEKA